MEEFGWWEQQPTRRRIAVWLHIVFEVVSLRSLRTNRHGLHIASLFLHWGVYLWFVTSIYFWGAALFREISLDVAEAIRVLGLSGGVSGLLGVGLLLGKRVADPELRSFTKPTRLVALVFLGLLFASRILLVLPDIGSIGREVALLRSVIGLAPFPGVDMISFMDTALSAMFVILIPWTHFSHSFAKYFTFHSVKWNDESASEGSKLERLIGLKLDNTPTWTAGHIHRGGGTGNWKKVASGRRDEA